MDVLYYSNNCKFCQKLLAHLAKIGVLEKYNFICIDRRSIDPNTRQVSITLDRGVKASLPPNVSRVPTLLLVNQKFTAVIGDDIYTYVNANVKQDPNNLAVQNGGEPIGYILSPSSGGVNIISETYTMYNAPPEELSAKGTGGTRQMHNYVPVNRDPAAIQTPTDEFAADTVKNAGHEVVGVQGFAGEISEAQRRESRKSNGAVPGMMNASRGLFPTGNSTSENTNIPTNASTYNAHSVPGVMYNTGQMIVPELQRPPAHRHVKIGEDITVDSLQQQRNMDLNNSLPFIAKQLNHIISPEVSNIQPPDRYNVLGGGGGGGGGRGQQNYITNGYSGQKMTSQDSQNILYGPTPDRQGSRINSPPQEICYL